MTRNPIGWFEIYVQDMERAQKFYESVLNVKLEKLSAPGASDIEMLAFPMGMDRPGASGALAEITSAHPTIVCMGDSRRPNVSFNSRLDTNPMAAMCG